QESNFLSLIGSSYYLQGKDEQAIEFLQKSLAIRREIKDKPAQLETLILLSGIYSSTAISFVNRGVYPQAKAEYSRVIELAQEALNLARELKKTKSEASALIHLGAAYSFFQDERKAIEVLQQAMSIARETKDLGIEDSALTQLASIYNTQDDSRKYIEIRLRQVEIARQQNNKRGEADVLLTLASTYNVLGENQKAVETYQQALAAARQIEIAKLLPNLQDSALSTESSALDGLSLSYSNLGEYDKAIDWAQQLLKRAQTLGKPELEVDALLRLAFLYNVPLKNVPKAIEVSQQALTIARKIKESSLEAKALASLSSAYNKQGNYPLALQSAEQCLAIAKQLENPQLEQNALDILEEIYSNQGNYQKAVEFAQA
ncbi:MAG TPA: tetratricopeptide repeat protein, partial [Phormidium sp.]